MPKIVEGDLVCKAATFAIVAARFNDAVVDRLVEGCVDALKRHGCKDEDITLVKVPGSFELPLVCKKLAEAGKHDAVIALGAVIRGGTPHFDYVAANCASGILDAGEDTGVPVIFGVLTVDTIEQAVERAGTKMGNKGADAAVTAIEMVNLLRALA